MILRKIFTGERAQFMAKNLSYDECTFSDGESPLKESRNVTLTRSSFKWKYPLWYSENAKLENCTFFEGARAGVWYTRGITFTDCVILAPKTFRRSGGITLKNVSLPHAEETLWNCSDVKLQNVTANGAYFGMNCKNVAVGNLTLYGDYCFDGAANITVKDSKLYSKDSFWNSKNVTVENSYISGEYLGWNSENLTLVNCTIESLQGLCYIKNLKLINCRLINTTLAFEYSTVEAEISGGVDSVLNPSAGHITAEYIGELTIEEDKVDPTRIKIICTGDKKVV